MDNLLCHTSVVEWCDGRPSAASRCQRIANSICLQDPNGVSSALAFAGVEALQTEIKKKWHTFTVNFAITPCKYKGAQQDYVFSIISIPLKESPKKITNERNRWQVEINYNHNMFNNRRLFEI
jgi:hypothetical protein